MKPFTANLLFIFITLEIFAADFIKVHRTLDWKEDMQKIIISNTKTFEVPYFTGSNNTPDFDYLPVFYENVPLQFNGALKVSIANPVYVPFTKENPNRNSPYVGNEIKITQSIGYVKKMPVAVVSFIPIRKNNFSGNWELLSEFDIEIQVTPDGQSRKSSGSRTYVPTSVLNIGAWYKISVGTQDGLYKIDYAFLKNLGMDVGNINPQNIAIYGNGGGMLPEENADFRYDDLVENSISVMDKNSNAKFDTDDYILFYGESPHQWKVDASTQRFYHEYNKYSEKTFYFLTIKSGPGKRFSSIPLSGSSTETVTEFDDRAFHELDDENLIQSGREWYGDKFNFNTLSRTFQFNFPNLVSSTPVYIKTGLVARATSSASTFTFYLNGQPVLSKSVTAVCPDYTCPYAAEAFETGTFSASQDQVNLSVNFTNPSSQAEGWINYIILNARRRLSFTGSQFLFRDKNSVGIGNKAQFVLQNANPNILILDVTDPTNVRLQQSDFNSGEIRFTAATDTLREFLAYDANGNFFLPEPVGAVINQNLHGTVGQPDMVIVAHPSLLPDAATLAAYHRSTNGLIVATVNVEEIYNEFSSGAQDISAIRDFMKMLYDRANSDTSIIPKYLLMFGDGSYDYKSRVLNNTNLVPVYQSPSSVSVVNSFVSDDYFGFLDDNEGGSIVSNNDLLDLAIGRFPVTTSSEAQGIINKIKHYQSSESLGNWRNNLTFVGDDEDGNVHMSQANQLAAIIESGSPAYNVEKILLDAYPQQSTPGGTRYPDVKDAIARKIFSGTLIMNYTGHGGVNGWAHERILDITDINTWENFDKLPLFITATCEFSKYDDPGKVSAGELVLLNPNGGAIGMVTTTRLVYSGANFTINSSFLEKAFTPVNGRMPAMGEAVMITKNAIPGDTNNRKFILLGDPAVMLAYPKYDVVTIDINAPIDITDDTLKALKKMTIKGEVRSNNQKMTDFNGVVYPTIFDKPVQVTTLKNDGGSSFNFEIQKSIIYKGKASVVNGEFTYTFIVPKDISYSFGIGKISYYAQDNVSRDANGYTDVMIGGTATDFEADNTGPELDVYMNDEKFAFGGITDENPLLLVKLADFSGINTAGAGIGHDITGVIDDDSKNILVLNEFYESDQDNYQAGKVQYPLVRLSEGRHTMKVKAWDVFNNSAEGYTEFVVAKSADLALSHVLNYPNPFTTRTSFQFEHNRPGESLFVQVKIFTVSGKLVKTIQEDVQTEGYRVDNIAWDGLDDYGDKIGRGVYVYKVNVRTPDGDSAHEFEKLVILR